MAETDSRSALDAYFNAGFDEHAAVAAATRRALATPFARLVELAADLLGAGGKILFFGNGGSAADAQHLAAELAVRMDRDRPAIAALALTTDSSILTAIGNDLGFDTVFARQIEALGRPGDMALALTTSGTSRNVVLGLETARRLDLVPAAFAGKGGGDLVGLADPVLVVPSDNTPRVQEMHITLGQLFCGALEQRLGLV
ncbi:MAG: SIS domain-containing protein [Rhodospirillales bacterium]|nr:SIS domain-containing protein [Rhodospirillales bacterium]MDH3909798.1 SIS domain-containing protein [Rhodospirillales bacterium]MDH3970344.1 SIS domain-containing protein [Rhodospirillales bacterium]